jgi:GNAT superfamily N-acetyltransferase
MRVAARAATQGDLPLLSTLVAACAAALPAERGGEQFVRRELLKPPYAEALATLLGEPDVLLSAGTIDDQVLALAVSRIETLQVGGNIARLELLFVDPDAREVGLGEALVGGAMSWAAGRGATRLDAYALPGNREAKNFLESSGFAARLIVMSLDLSRAAE